MGGDAGSMFANIAGRGVGALAALQSLGSPGGLANFMLQRQRVLTDPALRETFVGSPFAAGFFQVGGERGSPGQTLVAAPGEFMGPTIPTVAGPAELASLPARWLPRLPPLGPEEFLKRQQQREVAAALESDDPIVRTQAKLTAGIPLTAAELPAAVARARQLQALGGAGSQVQLDLPGGRIAIGSPYAGLGAQSFLDPQLAAAAAAQTGKVPVQTDRGIVLMEPERPPQVATSLALGEYPEEASAAAQRQPGEVTVRTGRTLPDGRPTFQNVTPPAPPKASKPPLVFGPPAAPPAIAPPRPQPPAAAPPPAPAAGPPPAVAPPPAPAPAPAPPAAAPARPATPPPAALPLGETPVPPAEREAAAVPPAALPAPVTTYISDEDAAALMGGAPAVGYPPPAIPVGPGTQIPTLAVRPVVPPPPAAGGAPAPAPVAPTTPVRPPAEVRTGLPLQSVVQESETERATYTAPGSENVEQRLLLRKTGIVTPETATRAQIDAWEAEQLRRVREQRITTADVDRLRRGTTETENKATQALLGYLNGVNKLLEAFPDPAERATFIGLVRRPLLEGMEAVPGFSNPRFQDWQSLVGPFSERLFERAGAALTEHEMAVLRPLLPTGKELSPAQFESRLQNFTDEVVSRLALRSALQTLPVEQQTPAVINGLLAQLAEQRGAMRRAALAPRSQVLWDGPTPE